MGYNPSQNPTSFSQKPFMLVTTDLTASLPSKANCSSESKLFSNFSENEFSTGWVLVGKLKDSIDLSPSSEKEPTSDGDEIKYEESIDFSAEDLNFVGYDELRGNEQASGSGIDNQACQILLISTHAVGKDEPIQHVSSITLDVMPQTDSGQATTLISGLKKGSNLDEFYSQVTLT